MHPRVRRTLFRLSLFAAAASTTGCFLLKKGDDDIDEDDVAALSAYAAQLGQLEEAMDSIPGDLPSLSSVELTETLRKCGAGKCKDGQWGNVAQLADVDREVGWVREAVADAEKGIFKPNVRTLAGMDYFQRIAAVRYFAIETAQSVEAYAEGTNAHWKGALAVWDSKTSTWLGEVSIELSGPDPTKFVTNIEFGADGSQTITYIDDPSGDRSRAQSSFDATVRKAFVAALATRHDVTRPEQALRALPRPLPAPVPTSGVVVVGADDGTLGVLGADGLVGLDLNQVTDVYPASDGLVLERAVNALPSGASGMRYAKGAELLDLRFWDGWGPIRNASVRVTDDGDLWAFDRATVGGGRVARWTEIGWSDVELEGSTRDVAVGGSVTFVLTSDGKGGSLLHVGDGTRWSSTPVEGSPNAVAASVSGVGFVGTGEGLWRRGRDGELTRLQKAPGYRLYGTDTGAVVGTRPKRARESKFGRVEEEGAVKSAALKVRDMAAIGVGRAGQVAAAVDGAVLISLPGQSKVRCEVSDRVRSVDIDAGNRTWIGTNSGLSVCVDGTVTAVPLTGVEGLGAGVRTLAVVGEGLDPSSL